MEPLLNNNQNFLPFNQFRQIQYHMIHISINPKGLVNIQIIEYLRMLLKNMFVLVTLAFFIHYATSDCNPAICQCSSSQLCTSCLTSHFLYDSIQSKCIPCSSNCEQCLNDGKCTKCVIGFTLNTQSQHCEECEIRYCSSCSVKNTCEQCIDGYALVDGNQNEFQCVPCAVENAETCETQTSVSKCLAGYWKNGDSCSPCREFCEYCTSSTNCLRCSDGYRPVISAGTYCAACEKGCKSCSSSSCLTCSKNFRLLNGNCISIEQECKNKQKCDSCEYVGGQVRCKECQYPYYYSDNNCIIGSSLICKNGALGLHPYNCLNSCPDNSYSIQNIENQQIFCKPKFWIKGTDKIQYFYSAYSYIDLNSEPFISYSKTDYVCQQLQIPIMYSQTNANLSSIFSLQKQFPPYYKITLKVKAFPLYKTVSSQLQVNIQIQMKDNATNQYSYTISDIQDQSSLICSHIYFEAQTKLVKDQDLTLDFIASIDSSSNAGYTADDFSFGIIGYSEILLEVYKCSAECRICSNSKYCLECYGQLFLYENQCVDQCYGLFQFYAPNGNPLDFTHKSCVQQCHEGFFNELSPFKEGIYICSLCQSPCKTCKSVQECLSCQSPFLYYDLGFSCITKCPSTHFNLSNICTPCNSPCKTCLSESTCLSCSIGFYEFNTQTCIPECPLGTFENLATKQCSPCEDKCIECQSSANLCKQCKNPYYLLENSCVEACTQKIYYENKNICELCKYPCYECISQLECTSCTSGYLLESNCYEQCPVGYYRNISASKCNKCKPECTQCLSQTTCQSCESGYYLSGYNCVSQCPKKTYPTNDTNMCLPCIQPCETCIDSEFCLSCQIGFLSKIQPGSCLFSCEDGFYESIQNGNIRQCLPCSEQCETCITKDKCNTCANTSQVLHQNKCLEQCPQGYYEINKQCQICGYPCSACQNSSQNCLSCVSPHLYHNNKCISQCLLGQYEANGFCLQCLYPCKTCTSESECLSCVQQGQLNNQTYLHEKQCIEECPAGTYTDLFTLKCRTCNYPCLTCSDSSSCLTCQSGYLTLQNKCEICPPGFYPNETSKQCEFCNQAIANCDMCYSQARCRYCETGYYLLTENSITTCIGDNQCHQKSGYFANSQQMTCEKCMLPCGQCSSQSNCQTCLTGYLLSSKCLLECPDGYYEESVSHTCQSCNTQICLTCTSSPIVCLSCNQTGEFSVLMNQDRICIRQSDCLEQYYIDNSFGYKRCLKCQPPCKTCSSARSCQSCSSGILHENQCRTSCPSNYFEQVDNATETAMCTICQQPCFGCRNFPQFCISCISSYFLEDSTCVEQCSEEYFLEQNTLQCKKCQKPCKACNSLSQCTSCSNQQLILYFGQCIDVCPDGTYKNQSKNKCFECPIQCQLCFQQGEKVKCQKCASGYFMSSSSFGICHTSCGIYQYSDEYTRDCHSCQNPCKSCLSGIKCTSCINGYLLYKLQCIKGLICPEKTFLDIKQLQCIDQCDGITYFGQQINRKCVASCEYNFVKDPVSKRCISQCPQGSYLSEDKLCQLCDSAPNGHCEDLLFIRLDAKSIFNVLYTRIIFSHQIELSVIKPEMIRIEYRELYEKSESRRRMLKSSQNIPIAFEINNITSKNTLWIKAFPNVSLEQVQIKVSFSSHYVFPSKVLQVTNMTTILSSFDYFQPEILQFSKKYETYSKGVSILLCVCLVINIVFNTGYLTYSMIDYYQFLFIFLYINFDYPPGLNYFLYGFRYAHYLFLPQIFTSQSPLSTTINTPEKFGILVSDASFLNNTGHDFLIIFIGIGALILFKFLDLLLQCWVRRTRSNQISNSTNSLPQKSSSKSSKSEDSLQKDTISTTRVSFVLGCIKKIVNRFKYNYFNDFLYLVYFYLVMFAFTQTYNMNPGDDAHYASIIFAVIFMILGTLWPFLLGLLIYIKIRNQQIFQNDDPKTDDNAQNKEETKLTDQKQTDSSKRISRLVNSSYLCFFSQIQPTYSNKIGLFLPIISYLRKYLLALLFVFCSNYPNFIMGVIVSSSSLLLIIKGIYRPYNNQIPFFNAIISEGLFILGCLLITFGIINRRVSTGSTTKIEEKIALAQAGIAIFILLSIYLAIYNLLMIIFTILNKLGKTDYYAKFNVTNVYASVNDNKQDFGYSSQSQSGNGIQESNMRFKIAMLNENQFLDKKLQDSESSSQVSSDLSIHLKKDKKTPQLLIKCIKGQRADQMEEEPQSQDSGQESQQIEKKQRPSISSNDRQICRPNILEIEEEDF